MKHRLEDVIRDNTIINNGRIAQRSAEGEEFFEDISEDCDLLARAIQRDSALEKNIVRHEDIAPSKL
jgi:hypothetical protein